MTAPFSNLIFPVSVSLFDVLNVNLTSLSGLCLMKIQVPTIYGNKKCLAL